jgi:trypsin
MRVRANMWAAVLSCAILIATLAYAQELLSLLERAIQRSKAKTPTNSRIFGGDNAQIEDNPWQVALLYAYESNNERAQFCGGSMISKEWVLTAAHCIDTRYKADVIDVLTGTQSLVEGGVRSKVERYRVHPKFKKTGRASPKDYDYDIALLKIDPTGPELKGLPIVGASEVSAAGVADGAMVHVTGWGMSELRPQGTITLQQVDIPLTNNDVCNLPRSYNKLITVNMLCAGERQGGKDACRGDSGGPATVLIAGQRRLLGVVSTGADCAKPDKYGIYTRVARFNDWIRGETNGAVTW